MSIQLSDQELGERIRGRRIAQGLRQAAFVGPGISAGYISLIESGQRRPSQAALDHILSVLGLTLEQLLGATPSLFTPQMKTIISQAEFAMRQDNPREALRLCATLSPAERTSPRVTVVEAEAHFVMGDIDRVIATVPQATFDLIEDRTWDYARRGLIVHARATSQGTFDVESILFVVKVRKLLQDVSSPDDLFVLQHAATLSGCLAEVGDVDGGISALATVEAIVDRVKNFRAKSSLYWAKAIVQVCLDQNEDAVTNLKQALEILYKHGDVHDRRRILTVYAGLVAERMPVDHESHEDARTLLHDEIKKSSSNPDLEVLGELKLLLAKLLVKNSQSGEAQVIIDEIASAHKLSDDLIAQLNLLRAWLSLESEDVVGAKSWLAASYETVVTDDVSTATLTTYREIADVYEVLGDHQRALEILRESNVRKSNIYAVLANELYAS